VSVLPEYHIGINRNVHIVSPEVPAATQPGGNKIFFAKVGATIIDRHSRPT
jgi:hypothetical protein